MPKDKKTASATRVGMYIRPHTRNRLNKFKADLSFVTGEIVPLDEAINILLDHYGAATPKQSAREQSVRTLELA